MSYEPFPDSQTLTSKGQTFYLSFANLLTSSKGTISNIKGEYEVPASKIVDAKLLTVTQTILTSVRWPPALNDPKFEKRVEIPIFSIYSGVQKYPNTFDDKIIDETTFI